MKKFLSLLLALTLVVGMLSAFTASAAVNTTVFYDASTNEQITSLDGVDSIYATTTFTGRYEDNASVIVSHYDANGKLLKVESITPVDSKIGASVTYTTPEISVADTDIIKIFAWTGVDTIKPLLKFPGVISRTAEIALPTATVTELDVATITEVPLTFAMNFKADPVTQAQLLAYGNWYADYELKINKDVTFNLDGTKDGYLAGQYDSWSPAWVQVPKKDVTLAANTPLKIMETGAETYGKPGLKYTCQEVFDRVKDFDCGVFFSEEFLAANPDIYVTLELRIYNPLDETQSYLINSETYEFGTKPEEAEVVDITNAPYAGVYAVKADAATTVSTEIGSTATLAAGETKYVYLLKGANIIGNANGANLTFYALEGNGLDYLDQVTANIPLAVSSISELTLSGNYTNAQHPYTDYGASGVAFGPDGSVDVTLTAPAAGLYVTQIQFATDAQAQMTVESDTGFYGVINQQAGRAGWNELHQGEHGVGNQDMEIIFLRAGENTITFKNTGAGDTLITKIKLAKTGSLASLEAYNWQLNVENLKVVVTEATPEEPTPTPTPTPEPTPDVPAEPEGDVVDITNAPYAGVYAVKADAATTVSTEIGSTATLAAGETKYVYLLKGANVLTNSANANLTFYALEGNGLDYLDQVTAEIPLAPSSISELTLSGNYTNGQHPYTDYGAAGVAFGPDGSVDVTLTAPAAGLYVTQIQFATDAQAQMTVESDTGFYGVINQQAGRVGWNELYQGEHGVGNQDMEIIFLRAGANTITFKNTGAGDTLITKIKLAKTGSLASLPAYNWQLNVDNLKVVEAATEGETTTVPTVLTYANVTAEVPAGVLLNAGVTDLSLTTTALENSESGVEAGENEKLSAFDVHVAGVSDENTTPIIVTINEATEKGYNKGNLSLFHVEDGVAVPMEEVETKEDLVKHNQFTYDPADGTISLAMANFSEIALLADTTKVWNGEYDYSWYDASKTELTISNADQMAGFSAIVGGMNGQTQDSFNGKTVKLMADLDFGGKEVAEPNDLPGDVFYPVGYNSSDGSYKLNGTAITSGFYTFEGTFDGNGHTIANIYQSTWIMKGDDEYYAATEQRFRDGMGIFGKVKGATIKNLTVDNFQCDGEYTTTGVIAAYADSAAGKPATFENIAITNCNPRVYNIGNGGIVGSGGWYSRSETLGDNTAYPNAITFKNITVDNTNKISALWGSWDVACAGIMGRYYPDSKCGVYFENCHVAAQIDVFNDVCGNYQYYWYRYAGMMIGTVQASTTDEKGYTIPDMTGVIAKDCTVHFGDWNDYYYCELVANSLASYTHDHQFSRLEQIQNVSEIQDKNGNWTRTGNFIVMNGKTPTETCYHIVKDANGNLVEHKHADAGTETVNGETVLKENNQRIYLPFNQLFQGSGWGVKNIPIYDDGKVYYEGITILGREVADSVVKFESVAADSYAPGATVTVGDLFKAVDGLDPKVAIDTDNVQVAISPKDENSNASGTYVADTSDWTKGTVTFGAEEGAVIITITDYYYCTATTIEVQIETPKPVDKFVGTTVTKQQVYGANGLETVTFTLGELFDATAEIDSANITVKGATLTKNGNNWEDYTVTFNAVGDYTVTINDNNLCKDATATAKVTKAANVDKWTGGKTANAKLAYNGTSVTVNFSDLFTDNGYIKGTITVTGGTYNASTGKVTVPCNKAGDYKVTITDDSGYANIAESTVKVAAADPINKFTGTTVTVQHTLATLNAKAASVRLGDIFTGTNVVTGNITVTIAGKATTVKASDWADASITVPGGVNETVTITINDNNTCITATGYVKFTAPATVKKWNTTNVSRDLTIATVGQNQTFNFTELFSEISGTYVGTLTVTVSGNGSYSNGVITVPGTAGSYTVTVKDNNYSKEATATITLNDAEPVTKFTVVGSSIKHTQATWKAQKVTTTLGAIFGEDATNGQYISGTVTYTIGSTAKTVSAANWASTSVSIPGGVTSVTIKIKDDNYCNETTATVKLTAPSTATKWTAKSDLSYEVDAGATKTLTLGDIFAAHSSNGKYIAGTVTYTVGSTSKTVDAANWASTSITVGAGETKVTIKDNNYSKTTEATVTVTELEPVRKFKAKDNYFVFQHSTVDPSASTTQKVSLGDIFAATGEGTINSATVTVTSSDTSKATVSVNTSDWTKSEVTFKGVTKDNDITLTITDNKGCMVSKAIIGVTPLWSGDVDGGDSGTAQVHYNKSGKVQNFPGTYPVSAGGKASFTLNVPSAGVYGIQWLNNGAAGTEGKAIFTANGYSVASTVPGDRTWSDSVNGDFVLYLKQGNNTITVQNVGTDAFTIYNQVNTMPLNKSGYISEDFMPLVKDITESGVNPDDEQGGTSGGPTPPAGGWPVPTIAWNHKFSDYKNNGSGLFGGYLGDIYSTSNFVSGTYATTYAVDHVEVLTITIPEDYYDGVYVLQFKVPESSELPAKIKATTAAGYYADYDLTEDGWSSSCAEDQLIYLKKGQNTIYVQNVGDNAFTLNGIDIGFFSDDNELYYMYDVAQKANGAIPN